MYSKILLVLITDTIFRSYPGKLLNHLHQGGVWQFPYPGEDDIVGHIIYLIFWFQLVLPCLIGINVAYFLHL